MTSIILVMASIEAFDHRDAMGVMSNMVGEMSDILVVFS